MTVLVLEPEVPEFTLRLLVAVEPELTLRLLVAVEPELTLRLLVAVEPELTLRLEVALEPETLRLEVAVDTLLEEDADADLTERLDEPAALRLATALEAPDDTLREVDLATAERLERLRSQPPAAPRTGEKESVLALVTLLAGTPP